MNNYSDIDAWIDDNWSSYVEDLTNLVEIPSVSDPEANLPNAPWGENTAKALNTILDCADRFGLEACNMDGRIGYADLLGKVDSNSASTPLKQLAIIGHIDVVPEGTGWNFPPYKLTEKEGCFIGRGVIDDKGPLLCALYAAKYWKMQADKGNSLPIDVRVIFGAEEESCMKDVAYYKEHMPQPDFLLTPDSEYPVCYGEKGLYNYEIKTQKLSNNSPIVELSGGTVINAVPALAHALVSANKSAEEFPTAPHISLETCSEEDGVYTIRIEAVGKSAHAATPWEGENAISYLLHYLVDNNLCCKEEREFFSTLVKLTDDCSGAGWGLACEDEHFGKLTSVGSVLNLTNGCYTFLVDNRYPSAITSDELRLKVEKIVEPFGGMFNVVKHMETLIVDPNGAEVCALIEAYSDATGDMRPAFTAGGRTYAGEFKKAVGFGVEKPWVTLPSWAGGFHAANEAVRIDDLKETIKIYILAIEKLAGILFK